MARMSGKPAGPVKVVVVDDDDLVRAGLRMMLDGKDGIEVVGEAADGGEVAEVVDQHAPHVVLMDLRMPHVDGITATRRLRQRPRPPEVIVLTTFDSDDNIVSALAAGASGFLLKHTPPAEISEAVRKVAAGDPMLSPRVMRRLMHRTVANGDERAAARAALDRLTDREREVALAAAQGASNAEIAAELFLSLPTVKAHMSSILDKLGLENRTRLALLAYRAELV